MTEYIIGVDVGATKSHLALFDTEGNYIDFDHWGPLNHEMLPGSYAQLEDELRQFVTGVVSRNKITMKQISYAVFGMGGVDTGKQHKIISEIIKRLGFERLTLCNDAYLGIPAVSRTGAGICANNGSGCTLAGINKDGKMLQIGGVGYLSADYGGGGMMGETAISAVYSELFRKGEPTSMTPVLFEKLGLTSKYDFVEKFQEKNADGSLKTASCAKMLFEAVWKNDKVASKILSDIGVSYARGISCMIDELKFPKEENLCIVFSGSVFVKSEHPLLLDTIKETVNRDNPGYNAKYTLLDVPPVAGALIWALNMLDNELDKGAYHEKIFAQLRERPYGISIALST
jgi:N-acetylglucosamine kinase-like BadF-type ATPase